MIENPSFGVKLDSVYFDDIEKYIAIIKKIRDELKCFNVLQINLKLFKFYKKEVTLFLEEIKSENYQLIIHLNSVVDVALVKEFNERYSKYNIFGFILHFPFEKSNFLKVIADVNNYFNFLKIRIFWENPLLKIEHIKYKSIFDSVDNLKVCYDIGHDILSHTNLINDKKMIDMCEIIHLHGVNLVNEKDHLLPWNKGWYYDDNLHKIALQNPKTPIIMEAKNTLDMDVDFRKIVKNISKCGFNYV